MEWDMSVGKCPRYGVQSESRETRVCLVFANWADIRPAPDSAHHGLEKVLTDPDETKDLNIKSDAEGQKASA